MKGILTQLGPLLLALFAAICMLLFAAANVRAAPFLVADPYPANADAPDAVAFSASGGAPVACTLKTVASGLQPVCDLAGLAAGTHTLVITATHQPVCTNAADAGTCTTYTPGVSRPFVFTSAARAAPRPENGRLSAQ